MQKKVMIILVLICGITLAPAVKFTATKTAEASEKYLKIVAVSKAVEALGKIGDPAARDILLRALRSKDFFVRAAAAQALGKIGEKTEQRLLSRLLNDESYLVRVRAAVSLLDLGQKDAEKIILGYLASDNPTLRGVAVEQAGTSNETFLRALKEMLEKEGDSFVRAIIIERLGDQKFKPALAHIHAALGDKDFRVRQSAVNALGEFREKENIPKLLQRLEDKNTAVRAAAKIALAKCGDRSKIEIFRKELDSDDIMLQTSSYGSLGLLGAVDIVPLLLNHVVSADSSQFQRRVAAGALRELKPRVDKLTASILEEAEILYGLPLRETLRFDYQVNGEDLVLLLVKALSNEHDPLYKDAPLLILELGAERALPALREALSKEQDIELIATIAHVLGDFSDKDAVGSLIKIIEKYGI